MTESVRTQTPLRSRLSRGLQAPTLSILTLLIVGCASPDHRAPVEDRSGSVRPVTPAPLPAGGVSTAPAPAGAGQPADGAAAPGTAEPPKLPPGAENAGKPGYYTVKPGDTLIRIGLETGQNWRDIARWNGLENPHVIEVGQVVRVVPPAPVVTGAVTRPVTPTGPVENRPLTTAPPASAASGTAAPAPAPAVVAAPAPPPPSPVADNDENVAWAWPAAGTLLAGFDEVRNKGLTLSGKAGDPVLAAADGRVVYSGSGLRGYGKLVIVKHNNLYLSAYAHNQELLVKEDQVVRRGQKIAEMGNTEADRVQLHFEIRRQGRPIDPARLLPAR